MRVSILIRICLSLIIFCFFISCKKETETLTIEKVSDYFPLLPGKYITYRLDSTVFTNLGRTEETHRYQVKHMVDAQVTDNLGRPSFRILQFIRDSIGTQPWTPNGTYFATPLTNQVEVIEDNLRFIKLNMPLALKSEWKGNRYISSDPYSSLYTFNNDDNMNDWNYKYDNFDASAAIGGQAVTNVYTVLAIDESLNAPVTNTQAYGARTLATEKYAKTIGLVSRDYILWEYQPNTGGNGGGYKTGFGIKMWMIDHN